MTASYEYYRIFYHVARLKSMSAAAAFLGSNQPNVSRTMTNLEAALGCKLMNRGHQGIELTAEGECFYQRLSVAMREIRRAETDVERMKNLEEGLIRIGVSEIAMQGILLPALPAYRKRYPGIQIRLQSGSTPDVLEALRSGAIELAVVTTSDRPGSDLTEQFRMECQDVIVFGKQYASELSTVRSVQDLTRFPLISLGDHSQSLPFFNTWAAKWGIQFHPELEVSSTEQILPLVRQGLGFSILPDFMTKAAVEQTDVIIAEIRESLPIRHLSALSLAGANISMAAESMIHMLHTFKE